MTADLEDDRNRIRRDLQQQGYRVVPDQPLPNTAEFTPQVQAHLEQSALSVHLVSVSEPQPPLATASIEAIQQQLVAARSREQVKLAGAWGRDRADFTRLLWLPPTADLTQADAFIQGLQSEPDFLRTNLESLKTLIHERLNPPAIAPPAPTANGALPLYLDCDERDLEHPDIEQLYEWLDERFQVMLPDFEAKGVASSERLIQQCEAVLIYYGEASGLWLKRRLLALKKTLYGRPKPLRAKAVYIADPSKQRFSDPEVTVIEGFRGFQPTLLDEFLASLGLTGGQG